MTQKQLYDMKLHETVNFEDTTVMRVPGGLLYTLYHYSVAGTLLYTNSVFVQLNEQECSNETNR